MSPTRATFTCTSCGSSFRLEQVSTTGWDDFTGKHIGKFEVVGTLGRGAFGIVLKARDQELDRTVAIKIPRPGNIGDRLQDVERFLREARSVAQLRFSQGRLEGTLSDKEKSRVHPFKMAAGQTCVIVLESAAFDAFLILEDPAGKKMAENDDIDPGVNTNARLVFQAPKTTVYHLVATSFEQRGSGAYVLTVHEFNAAMEP